MTLGTKDMSTEIINHNPILYQENLRDDRVPVALPNVWPNRCVGQILIKYQGESDWARATGSLVSDYTVLTAGHVVKKTNNEYYNIEGFKFIPARNHSTTPEPYGVYGWKKMKAVFNGGSRDWALISLAQPAGFRTGFLGVTAKYPINRWKSEGDRFQHIGFPYDHLDEMWIDEDGVCTDIYDGRMLQTNIDAARGQSGGPLTINWGSSNSQVCGCLSGGPNPVEDPNYFAPGYEDVKTDVWMQVLCDEYGRMNADDRFAGCSTSIYKGDCTFTEGMLPNYNNPHYFSEDKGPVIRRFSPRYNESWMTPHRLGLMLEQQGRLKQ